MNKCHRFSSLSSLGEIGHHSHKTSRVERAQLIRRICQLNWLNLLKFYETADLCGNPAEALKQNSERWEWRPSTRSRRICRTSWRKTRSKHSSSSGERMTKGGRPKKRPETEPELWTATQSPCHCSYVTYDITKRTVPSPPPVEISYCKTIRLKIARDKFDAPLETAGCPDSGKLPQIVIFVVILNCDHFSATWITNNIWGNLY